MTTIEMGESAPVTLSAPEGQVHVSDGQLCRFIGRQLSMPSPDKEHDQDGHASGDIRDDLSTLLEEMMDRSHHIV